MRVAFSVALVATVLPFSTAFVTAPPLACSGRTFRVHYPIVASQAPRALNAEEEKALRKVRLDFGGYPPKKYFEIEEEKGKEAAWEQVRSDHPILAEWSDDELAVTKSSLSATPVELLTQTPIGPFLFLSSIAIVRSGGFDYLFGPR